MAGTGGEGQSALYVSGSSGSKTLQEFAPKASPRLGFSYPAGNVSFRSRTLAFCRPPAPPMITPVGARDLTARSLRRIPGEFCEYPHAAAASAL